MNPINFRPSSEKQYQDLKRLAHILELTESAAMRLAVDDLIAKHRAQLDAAAPAYEAAQQALADARQAAAEVAA